MKKLPEKLMMTAVVQMFGDGARGYFFQHHWNEEFKLRRVSEGHRGKDDTVVVWTIEGFDREFSTYGELREAYNESIRDNAK